MKVRLKLDEDLVFGSDLLLEDKMHSICGRIRRLFIKFV